MCVCTSHTSSVLHCTSTSCVCVEDEELCPIVIGGQEENFRVTFTFGDKERSSAATITDAFIHKQTHGQVERSDVGDEGFPLFSPFVSIGFGCSVSVWLWPHNLNQYYNKNIGLI